MHYIIYKHTEPIFIKWKSKKPIPILILCLLWSPLEQWMAVPEIRTDCSKNIPMTGECFPMIHFHHDVCQLSFIIHGLQLLENTTGMEGVHSTADLVWGRDSVQCLWKLTWFYKAKLKLLQKTPNNKKKPPKKFIPKTSQKPMHDQELAQIDNPYFLSIIILQQQAQHW